MEIKGVFVFVVMALVFNCVHNTSGSPLPRDSSVVITDEVLQIDNGFLPKSKHQVPVENSITTEINNPYRVSCHFDETTEDPICQEHCLPKGYSYGLCVSYTCTCI